jgi:hypothetical protein
LVDIQKNRPVRKTPNPEDEGQIELKLTINNLPFTKRLPLALYREQKTANARKAENRKWLVISLFLGIASSLCQILGGSASAQTNVSPQGITVSPAFQMVTIAPGATEQPVTFTITNNRPSVQELNFSVADFNTLNESGGLFFVGTNPTELQKKYGLAKWISLSTGRLVVQPKQTVSLKASILNLPDLQPGGHYGALMIALGGESAKAGQVGIHPIASSLLFVTKPQGATHGLSLSSVDFNKSLTNLPKQVTLRLQNTGNTHVVPRGIVTITKAGSGGTIYSKGVLNQDSQIILPQTYRRFTVQLNSLASARLPGKYSLHVDFRFDGIDQFRGYQQSFFVVTAWALAAAASLLIMILIALVLIIRRRAGSRPKSRRIKVKHL